MSKLDTISQTKKEYCTDWFTVGFTISMQCLPPLPSLLVREVTVKDTSPSPLYSKQVVSSHNCILLKNAFVQTELQ